jgi:hypothetical protein
MPTPGIDCHIVIDGIGYIFADIASAEAESRQDVNKEQLAPFFGDPVNVLDPLSSDLTMLLPIGQNDFSDGMGGTDLEANPKGFERGENLIVTPAKTLVNGPMIWSELFASVAPTALTGFTGPDKGWFAGGNNNSVRREYITFTNGSRYYHNGTVWADLPGAGATPSHLDFYSGIAIMSYSSIALDMANLSTIIGGTFDSQVFFSLGGRPFIVHKDGRVYAAFIAKPTAPGVVVESGAIVAQRNWLYHVVYQLATGEQTELGTPSVITKTGNGQVRLTLPVRTYRGGQVQRTLWRSVDNDQSILYQIASAATLGPFVTNYLDAADDAAITGLTQWNYNNLNSSSINVLSHGAKAINMAYPDTDPIFMPESASLPSTGANVQVVEVFRNQQGNEAAIIGTTVGLFLWDGASRLFQRLTSLPYHSLNCAYLAINHGVVYYTIAGVRVKIWSPDSESDLLGPWITQFSTVREIRARAAGPFVYFAVSGLTNYDTNETAIIYAFDGKSFVWSTRIITSPGGNKLKVSMGELPGRFQLCWYDGITGNNRSFSYIDLTYPILNYQTSNVVFRSGTSDLQLPRLRKQVHGVMVRYAQLTTQTATTLATNAAKGDTAIGVVSATGFSVGDWFCVKNNSIKLSEYRKITSIVGNTISFTHSLGAGFIFAHTIGDSIVKCAAVVSLRNMFTDTIPTGNIEIGGPHSSGDVFALIMLPVPVYTFADSIEIVYNAGTVMEIQGWSMLTALNPEYNGLMDMSLRIQDNVPLPNGTKDNAIGGTRQQNLITSYNKGTVTVIDPLNNSRVMRFQRLSFEYEEPPERHTPGLGMRATAHIRLIDQTAELMKQETLTLTGLSR